MGVVLGSRSIPLLCLGKDHGEMVGAALEALSPGFAWHGYLELANFADECQHERVALVLWDGRVKLPGGLDLERVRMILVAGGGHRLEALPSDGFRAVVPMGRIHAELLELTSREWIRGGLTRLREAVALSASMAGHEPVREAVMHALSAPSPPPSVTAWAQVIHVSRRRFEELWANYRSERHVTSTLGRILRAIRVFRALEDQARPGERSWSRTARSLRVSEGRQRAAVLAECECLPREVGPKEIPEKAEAIERRMHAALGWP